MISDHNDADFEEKVKQVSKDVFELHTTVENVLKGEICRSMCFMAHSFVWTHLLGRNCWIAGFWSPVCPSVKRFKISEDTSSAANTFSLSLCTVICLLRKDILL